VSAVASEGAAFRPCWLHEIKHDGFRILARRDSAGVRLITRAGSDFSGRFPFIAMAVGKLPVRSCLIDGEAIVCDDKGLAVFELIRRHGALATAVHCAFDLLELDGKDLRRQPIEERKQLLAKLLRGSNLSIVLNEIFEEDGANVFREACKLGCEGIVSKRLGSPLSLGAFSSLGEGQKSESAGRHARGGGGLAEIIKTYVPPKVLTTATSMVAHAYVLAAELFLAFLPPPAPPVQPSRATAAPSSDICVSTPG
jgi:bifunctional non-homologous end joining protein LigD